jgi:hypothetical protein
MSMKRTTLILSAAVVAVLLAAIPVLAHHSFAAQYDGTKTIKLTGTITKLEWMNPHIYFYMDVKGADGKVETWAFEGGAPNSLYRAGWRKDSLKRGDTVTVDGALAKDGSKLVNARQVVMANGKKVFAGSSGGDEYTARPNNQ